MDETLAAALAREAEEAEALAEAEERGDAAPKPGQRARRQGAEATQVYSVRIPVDRLEDLRQLAARLDVPPSVLLRRWVLERLDRELGGESVAHLLGSREADFLAAVVTASKQAVTQALREAAQKSPERVNPVRRRVDEISEDRYLDPSGPIRLGATRRLATQLSPADIAGSDAEDDAGMRSEHV